MMKELFFEIVKPELLIEKAVELSELARREGLLKMEEKIPEIEGNNPIALLLMQGLQLIVDGTDPELVRNILEIRAETLRKKLKYRWLVWKNFLLESYSVRKARPAEVAFEHLLYRDHPENPLIVENLNTFIEQMFPLPENPGQALKDNLAFQNSLVNSCLLVFFSDSCSEQSLNSYYETYKDLYFSGVSIAIDSCLSIQSGDNPRIVRDKLYGYTGQVHIEAAKIYSQAELDAASLSEEEIEALLSMGDGSSDYLESFLFNQMMSGMDDRALQRILRELNTQEIAKALKDTTEQIVDRIFANQSQQAAEMIKDDLRDMGPLQAKDIADAKRYILNIIRKLEQAGEIVMKTHWLQ